MGRRHSSTKATLSNSSPTPHCHHPGPGSPSLGGSAGTGSSSIQNLSPQRSQPQPTGQREPLRCEWSAGDRGVWTLPVCNSSSGSLCLWAPAPPQQEWQVPRHGSVCVCTRNSECVHTCIVHLGTCTWEQVYIHGRVYMCVCPYTYLLHMYSQEFCPQ